MNRKAHAFQLHDCGDPKCGVHVVALDHDDNVIVEIVMSPQQTLNMIHYGQDVLYHKVVIRDGS